MDEKVDIHGSLSICEHGNTTTNSLEDSEAVEGVGRVNGVDDFEATVTNLS